MNTCARNTALLAVLTLSAFSAHAGSAFTTGYFEKGSSDARGSTVVTSFVNSDIATDRWKFFEFPKEALGVGDATITAPFGNVEYKINAINYNLFLSDDLKIPFQLYFADIASNKEPEKVNEAKLLDPTQGIAVQFPIAGIYKGGVDGGICHFVNLKGYCMLGGDMTLRGVQLNEQDATGKIKESMTFGASASLRASALFPIFEAVPGTDQAGHLSLGVGGRYYYQSAKKSNLLFGPITTPNGTPVEFETSFAALSAELEFDVYKHIKVRLEYFHPLGNRDVLKDVVKAGIVIAPKAP